ncbi:MAG TPA: hypothetical protein VHF87_20390 [Methylomirabilota bacterium]|nr:hypothetical protein [Methylomirabilota bacterium]
MRGAGKGRHEGLDAREGRVRLGIVPRPTGQGEQSGLDLDPLAPDQVELFSDRALGGRDLSLEGAAPALQRVEDAVALGNGLGQDLALRCPSGHHAVAGRVHLLGEHPLPPPRR